MLSLDIGGSVNEDVAVLIFEVFRGGFDSRFRTPVLCKQTGVGEAVVHDNLALRGKKWTRLAIDTDCSGW